jgi:molybdopterin converting factor small subunit
MRDPGEFMSTLKVDLYPEEVYTFTPKGKVMILPRDATPIDFAYSIHSDVGNTCVGAKVNGRIVPLKYNLKNGDVVEILTQSQSSAEQGLVVAGQDFGRATKSSTSSTPPSAPRRSRSAKSTWNAKRGG